MQKKIYILILILISFGSCHSIGMRYNNTRSYTNVPLLLTLAAGGVGCYWGYKNSLNEIGNLSTTFGSLSFNYIPETLITLAKSRQLQLFTASFIALKIAGCINLGIVSGINYTNENYASSFLTLLSAAGIAFQTGCEYGILKQALDTFYSSRLSLLSASFSLKP